MLGFEPKKLSIPGVENSPSPDSVRYHGEAREMWPNEETDSCRICRKLLEVRMGKNLPRAGLTVDLSGWGQGNATTTCCLFFFP